MPGPLHERFSTLYGKRGAPLQDSKRLRARCASQWKASYDTSPEANTVLGRLARLLDTEVGAELERPTYPFTVENFLKQCAIEDFLDALTMVYRAFSISSDVFSQKTAARWLDFVERAFREENVCYRIDSKGVVHFLVDAEFDANVGSLIAALSASRFSAARDAFARAREDMAKPVPDVIDATRAVFESAESVFKVAFDTNAKLDAGEVKRTLGPFIDRKMTGLDAVAKGANARIVDGFAHWVNACHPYRHGHKAERAVEPPMDVAVWLVSTGAGFIRWLATVSDEAADS
jgi:hypothetical protein